MFFLSTVGIKWCDGHIDTHFMVCHSLFSYSPDLVIVLDIFCNDSFKEICRCALFLEYVSFIRSISQANMIYIGHRTIDLSRDASHQHSGKINTADELSKTSKISCNNCVIFKLDCWHFKSEISPMKLIWTDVVYHMRKNRSCINLKGQYLRPRKRLGIFEMTPSTLKKNWTDLIDHGLALFTDYI